MTTQETGGQELRERITLAIMGRTAPRAAAAVLAELGYGTHRCVRCGQPQAQEDDTCPPCDGEIYREEILELRAELDAKDAQIAEQQAEIERLAEEREQYQRAAKIFKALRLVLDTGQAPSEWAKPWRDRAEQAEAELAQWRAAFGETALPDQLARFTELRQAEAERDRLKAERAGWRSMAGVDEVEAERDRLRAAEKRVREIAERAKRRAAENSEPGDQLNPYVSVASILAALDQPAADQENPHG